MLKIGFAAFGNNLRGRRRSADQLKQDELWKASSCEMRKKRGNIDDGHIWATVWYNLRMSWNICFLFKRLEAPWEFFLGANRVSVCCLWELHFLPMTLDYDSCTNLMLEGNDFLALGIEHTYTPMAKKQVGQSIKLRCWRDVWNSVSQIGAKILFCSRPELPWQQDIWMELSQQYNDNVPAKSFYVHMFLEEKR